MLYVNSLAQAEIIIKDNFNNYNLSFEDADISECIGRVCAVNIYSLEDIPSFRRSTLDGYAVKAEDTFGASEAIPSMLKLVGQVKMGQAVDIEVFSGQAVYVPTGGFIPNGADAVAMIEIAEALEQDILIYKSIPPSTGIVYIGDDVKNGQLVIKEKELIKAKHIGALAALGMTKIKVLKKLVVGIISTGDEIVEIDENIDSTCCKMRDVNTHFLKALATEFFCEPKSYGVCRDDKDLLTAIIKKAHAECELVLISGGSSVGIMDNTYQCILEATGGEILIHGLSMKPGKPTIIAKANGNAIIGLPGHPVSAFFVMKEVISKLIFAMVGTKPPIKTYINATLCEKVPSNNGRDDFIPVTLETIGSKLCAIPIGYKSGLITLLSKADGYIHINGLAEGLDKGTMVEVYSF
jgi:molybdopterin molybdotransferase